jgi:hypothetical protein
MFMMAQSLYAQKSGLTYTLAFQDWLGDELCDTLTVTVGTNNLVTGTDNNYDCAGDNTWIDGITSLPVGKFDGPGPEPNFKGEGIGPISVADNAGALELDGAAATIYLNFKTNTWSSYVESTGIGPEVWGNNGTFSIVEAAATTGGKASIWTKHSNVIVSLPFLNISGYPTGSFELVLWDNTHSFEYCDYFELSAYGDLVGGTHNLTTACAGFPSNAPIGGNYTFLPTGIMYVGSYASPVAVPGGRGLYLTDNELYLLGEDASTNWYFDFQSNIWAVYDTDGTTGLLLDNWGALEVFDNDPLTAKTAPHPTGGPLSNTPHNK